MKSQYVWSPEYIDALILRDQDLNGAGDMADTNERLYALQDANYKVTAVATTAGTIVERYVYTPYGEATVYNAGMTGPSIASPATSWVYLHQGTRFDSTVGLYHNRNRDYSPTLGRWISSDPLQFGAGDPNFYRFVSNSPGNYVDPLGLRFEVGMDTANAIDGPGGGGVDSRGFWDRSDEALFKYGEGVREAAREQIIDPAIELFTDPLGTVESKCVKIRDSSLGCWNNFKNGLGYIRQVGVTAAANKFGQDMSRGGQLAVDVFMQNPSKNLGKLTLGVMMGEAGVAGGKLAVQLGPKVPGLVKHPAVGRFLADESGAVYIGGSSPRPRPGSTHPTIVAGPAADFQTTVGFPGPQYFQGTDKPWISGATPGSIYTYVDPKTGKALENAIYNWNGDVIGHVDFKNHGLGSGHGHLFPPGLPGLGHGYGTPHIPFYQLPPDWIRLPPGIKPHTPIGR